MTSELIQAEKEVERPPFLIAEAPRPLAPWSRYEDQIFANLPDDFEVRFVGGVTNLAEVDVIHTSGSLDRMMRIDAKMSSSDKLEKTKSFISALKTHDVRLARTIHEVRTKPADKHQSIAARYLDENTDLFIRVDEAIATAAEDRTETIPYADMTDRFLGFPTRARTPGAILVIAPEGRVIEAESLVKTIGFTREHEPELKIAGQSDPQLIATLDHTATDDRVIWRCENLSDAAYVEEITASDLVFPPDPRTLYGYHLMMLALTFNRPVAVLESSLTKNLAEEIGPTRVITYPISVTPAFIDRALSLVEASRSISHYLPSERALSRVSNRYFQAFRSLLNGSR